MCYDQYLRRLFVMTKELEGGGTKGMVNWV
jgi:hypothetical protein